MSIMYAQAECETWPMKVKHEVMNWNEVIRCAENFGDWWLRNCWNQFIYQS